MTKRERSQKIFQEAKTLIPGGVNSPARAFGAVGGEPIVMARGKGACLFDVDDNCYIDYVLSWGPMILGHTHPQVTAVLEDAIHKGTSFGTPTENENRLAQLVISLVPSIEKIRLVNSGTEATMSAIRLARGYTGRNKIVKFIGNYHGHVDSLLVAAGSSAATLSVPNSPGVTAGTTGDTILLPYNDVSSFRSLFAQQGSEIAAIIVEPVAGNMGCVPGSLEFLQTLRKESQKTATILIFDEVMSGFRVARGGAQERFGIIPDLTTLGKVIGGGLPVGAYGGRTEIMDHVLPQGKVFQAGTLSGNPLATAAGIATLSEIANDPFFYDKLEQKTNFLADGLLELGRKNGVKLSVGRCGSMMTLFFPSDRDDVIIDWATASRCDTKRFARYFWNMLNRGIYLPCSQFETMFLSIAHSDEMLQQTLDAADQALRLDR
ncbi:MAG: glutamate-1-semialdehyde 2,1-aminomutase [Planctomycetia bacterium]|nr:glutamate-1-semialdehyde 2,1-aminomutase [Planctomycetia bacterium]